MLHDYGFSFVVQFDWKNITETHSRMPNSLLQHLATIVYFRFPQLLAFLFVCLSLIFNFQATNYISVMDRQQGTFLTGGPEFQLIFITKLFDICNFPERMESYSHKFSLTWKNH